MGYLEYSYDSLDRTLLGTGGAWQSVGEPVRPVAKSIPPGHVPFLVNGHAMHVPLVGDTALVVAEASKVFAASGGLQVTLTPLSIVVRVHILDVPNAYTAAGILWDRADQLGARVAEVLEGARLGTLRVEVATQNHLYIDLPLEGVLPAEDTSEVESALGDLITKLVGAMTVSRRLDASMARKQRVHAFVELDPADLFSKDLDQVVAAISSVDDALGCAPALIREHNRSILALVEKVLESVGQDGTSVVEPTHTALSRDRSRRLARWSSTEAGLLRGDLWLPVNASALVGQMDWHCAAFAAVALAWSFHHYQDAVSATESEDLSESSAMRMLEA